MRAAAQRLLLAARISALSGTCSTNELLPAGATPAATLLGPLMTSQQRGHAVEAEHTFIDAAAPQQAIPLDEGCCHRHPAAATAASNGTTLTYKPPCRLRSNASQQFDDRVVDFATRLFACDLDTPYQDRDEEEQLAAASAAGGAGKTGGGQPESTAPGPQAVTAAEKAAAAAAAAAEAARQAGSAATKNFGRAKMHKGRKAQLAHTVERLQGFEVWLQVHAEGVAALRVAADKLGLDAEPILLHIHASRAAHLLSPAEENEGAGSEGTSGGQVQVEARLRAALVLLASLGIVEAGRLRLLAACPQLAVQPPDEEAVAALRQLFGGRLELAGAMAHNPAILLLHPSKVQRRLQLLALHLHCEQGAAASAVAGHPALLTVSDKTITASARFLGSLLPMRPYATLVQRFPGLLAARLEGTLHALQQRAPPELAAVDMKLLASQQPTLLLASVAKTLAVWRQLRAACEGVPEWREELEALAQPMLTRQELAARAAAQQAAAGVAAVKQEAKVQRGVECSSIGTDAADGRSWYTHVLYSASSTSSEASQAVAAPLGGDEESPIWLHQDERSLAVAAVPGALGTLHHNWLEGDRLRARTLARLLDARRWQLQRLEFLAQRHPEEAGHEQLLDVVMASKADFEWHHPGFPAWLEEQRRAEAAAAVGGQQARAVLRESRAAAVAAFEDALTVTVPQAETTTL